MVTKPQMWLASKRSRHQRSDGDCALSLGTSVASRKRSGRHTINPHGQSPLPDSVNMSGRVVPDGEGARPRALSRRFRSRRCIFVLDQGKAVGSGNLRIAGIRRRPTHRRQIRSIPEAMADRQRSLPMLHPKRPELKCWTLRRCSEWLSPTRRCTLHQIAAATARPAAPAKNSR
jgi:hypothetical protein